MINTGINAIIGLQLKKITPNQKLLSTSIIIGIIIPDIDLIIDYLLSVFIGFNFLIKSLYNIKNLLVLLKSDPLPTTMTIGFFLFTVLLINLIFI